MTKKYMTLLAAMTMLLSIGCTNKDQLKKTLEENPDIILNVIEKHPKKFLDTLNKAVGEARQLARKQQEKQEQDSVDEEFKNPKKPEINEKRVFHGGSKDSPITIVEYSDFECPFCTRGYKVMEDVKKKYGDKVRILYKHLPLNFHPMAMPAAQYYEAIAMQSHSKAVKFHDLVFQNQSELKSGKEKFLDKMAKKVGANMGTLKKDLKSDKVAAIIKSDMAEAQKFGFSGTPGFLVNGVSVRGAYPLDHFEKLIDKHLKK